MDRNTKNKIKALFEIAQELSEGKNFQITRLTRVKSLCTSQEAIEQFGFYILKLRCADLAIESSTNTISSDKGLIDYAQDYLEHKTETKQQSLEEIHTLLKSRNNQYQNQSWGTVRIIEDNDALMGELCLNCILTNGNYGGGAYELARQYAERYNPRYGTGLLPESAPFVADIADFWQMFYSEQHQSSLATE